MKSWFSAWNSEKTLVSATAVVVLLMLLGTLLGGKVMAPDRAHYSTHAVHPPSVPKPQSAYTFPDGGRQIFPNYRLAALYGSPNASDLGVLGQQSLADTITRAKGLAANYQPFSTEHVMPTLEIITTLASASPTNNGDYSQEIDPQLLQTWIDAARQAGVYVVLDLQPGRSDFLTQAKEYQRQLEEPNVGLALDPEWRLAPNQVPMAQIGSVDIHEVNATAGWLADLVRQHNLPQKLFMLHEFRSTMLPNRDQLNTSYTQLAYVVQMDGQGPQSVKMDTWAAVTADPPVGVHFGWKNFYEKDPDLQTPQQTMQIVPQPWYVSYQ